MRRTAGLLILTIAIALFLVVWNFTPHAAASRGVGQTSTNANQERGDEPNDPDLPAALRGKIDKAEYIRLREEHIHRLRGIEPGRPFDPEARGRAIVQMEDQERQEAEAIGNSPLIGVAATPTWKEIGPANPPLQNGQTEQFPAVSPVTGRATAVVVDPTNSNKIYLGTADGGVWRSLDGGTTWTTIFDRAQSLGIGALALAPSNPTILYVGTGEPNLSCGEFFGVGLYRIDHLDTTPTLVGPINPTVTTGSGSGRITTHAFTGNGITKILVKPDDPATIFVSTGTGTAGLTDACVGLSQFVPPLGLLGVYRSTNATALVGSIAFTKIVVTTDSSLDNPGTGEDPIFDMVFEPGNPNNLLVTVFGQTNLNASGVYRSTNALSSSPTFIQTLAVPDFTRLQLSINKNSITKLITVYANSSESSANPSCFNAGEAGRLRVSKNGGQTWSAPLPAAEGFCGSQCTYDIPIAVHPNNANIVYLGGNGRGQCSDVMKRSQDGGMTFTRDDTNLHADNHAIFFDMLTTPETVWTATDGGAWKRHDAAAGARWLDENNQHLGTIQFDSLAVHPLDRNFTIGGTQDNGTNAQSTSGSWFSAESGDGGYSLMDQSATDTDLNLKAAYHTFFNQANVVIGFDRTEFGHCIASVHKDSWAFRGFGVTVNPTPSCDGQPFAKTNGISGTDNVNFYAPMALGPGSPNRVYFGTDRLYRSVDRGETMVVASQAPLSGSTISSIGISPQNDKVRIVGLNNGQVFATITGSSTLINVSPALPPNPDGSTTEYISRAVIDPKNPNTAYVTLSYYAQAGQGIWKTTKLNNIGTTMAVTWAPAGSGIPSIPIEGFVVDPLKSTTLYAGTDIGVYQSLDGGATWHPFGTGLPRVAVFDVAIQSPHRLLRGATFGRGMWEIPIP